MTLNLSPRASMGQSLPKRFLFFQGQVRGTQGIQMQHEGNVVGAVWVWERPCSWIVG